MNEELIRKEVWLWEDRIKRLQEAADKKEWSLKKYMEYILVKEANRIEKSKTKLNERH